MATSKDGLIGRLHVNPSTRKRNTVWFVEVKSACIYIFWRMVRDIANAVVQGIQDIVDTAKPLIKVAPK